MGSHEEFNQTTEGTHTTHTRLQARRCVSENWDEVQIEISIKSVPRGGKRQQWLLSSFILSPTDARRLALAICPELGEIK